MQKLKNILIEAGYRYFLFQSIESFSSGIEIFHYCVLPEPENKQIEYGAILIDSYHGEEIIEDFLIGNAKLYIYTGAQLYVQRDGSIFEESLYKPLLKSML